MYMGVIQKTAERDCVLQGGSGLGKQLHSSSFTGVQSCEERGDPPGKWHQDFCIQGYLLVEHKSLSLTVVISCGRTRPRYEAEYITALGLVSALHHSHG